MFNAMRLIRKTQGFPKEIIIRGKLAEKLAKKYSKYKPYYEWKGEHEFLGEIEKKEYFLELDKRNQ